MNKNGFTLVELLAVIALLSIVIALAVPSINKLRNSALEREKETQIKEIESSALFYAKDESIEITDNMTVSITVKTLIDTDYINPNTENNVSGCSNVKGCLFNPFGFNLNSKQINLTNVNGKIKAEYQE